MLSSGSQRGLISSFSYLMLINLTSRMSSRQVSRETRQTLVLIPSFPQRTIEGLKGNDDKIRVVLNKADLVSAQQLMRVYVPRFTLVNAVRLMVSRYGAMMWSLGKVVRTPEVMRVYIGILDLHRFLFVSKFFHD